MRDMTFDELYRGFFAKVYAGAGEGRGSQGEYKGFVRDFYKGKMFVDGWIESTEDAVSKAGGDAALQQAMNKLGQLFSCEWALPNDYRKLDTNMLKRWGSEAKENGAGLAVITGRLRKVEAVLRKKGKKIPRVLEYGVLKL